MHMFENYECKQLTDRIRKNLPVMVWIHGGGFFAGSGNPDIYGPDYFMDYDVIVVSVNYRVGPLGFFTLENEEVKNDYLNCLPFA
jgi:carboxylesterase type B